MEISRLQNQGKRLALAIFGVACIGASLSCSKSPVPLSERSYDERLIGSWAPAMGDLGLQFDANHTGSWLRNGETGSSFNWYARENVLSTVEMSEDDDPPSVDRKYSLNSAETELKIWDDNPSDPLVFKKLPAPKAAGTTKRKTLHK